MSVTISGDTGVSKVQDGVIVQADLASGVAGNGPAFSARESGNQSVGSAANTLVTFATEDFDTNSCYNNTGSTVGGIPAYAFLPNVAGYYQINAGVYSQNNNVYTGISIRKNGSEYINGTRNVVSTNAMQMVSGVVYLNGSTDYVQVYFYSGSATVLGSSDLAYKHFSGCMVRGA